MPKRAVPTSRPEILLDARLPMPLYKQLYERLRRGILSGQLERGMRLPSTRQLASELGISRTIIVLAHESLLLEGYLESRVGQGTVVAGDLPLPLLIWPGGSAGRAGLSRCRTPLCSRQPSSPAPGSTHELRRSHR
jgi:GntR family transcriptional regulator / MocR family aminotransferase